MLAAGMASDDGMSQTRVHGSAVACVDDQAATGGADAIYQCTVSTDAPPTK